MYKLSKTLEICLKMSKSNKNVPKPLKFLDSWPCLIPSPDIQKTKFFQFLLLASSLAQKLKKFCFLDVWVGIHLVVSGYRVVIICILSKKGQKPPKFAHLWRLNRLAQKKAIYSFGCVQTSRFSTNFDLGKVFINGGESTQKPKKWQFSPSSSSNPHQ